MHTAHGQLSGLFKISSPSNKTLACSHLKKQASAGATKSVPVPYCRRLVVSIKRNDFVTFACSLASNRVQIFKSTFHKRGTRN